MATWTCHVQNMGGLTAISGPRVYSFLIFGQFDGTLCNLGRPRRPWQGSYEPRPIGGVIATADFAPRPTSDHRDLIQRLRLIAEACFEPSADLADPFPSRRGGPHFTHSLDGFSPTLIAVSDWDVVASDCERWPLSLISP